MSAGQARTPRVIDIGTVPTVPSRGPCQVIERHASGYYRKRGMGLISHFTRTLSLSLSLSLCVGVSKSSSLNLWTRHKHIDSSHKYFTVTLVWPLESFESHHYHRSRICGHVFDMDRKSIGLNIRYFTSEKYHCNHTRIPRDIGKIASDPFAALFYLICPRISGIKWFKSSFDLWVFTPITQMRKIFAEKVYGFRWDTSYHRETSTFLANRI